MRPKASEVAANLFPILSSQSLSGSISAVVLLFEMTIITVAAITSNGSYVIITIKVIVNISQISKKQP